MQIRQFEVTKPNPRDPYPAFKFECLKCFEVLEIKESKLDAEDKPDIKCKCGNEL